MITISSVSVLRGSAGILCFFFFQAEDGIRDVAVTGVQTCALPIFCRRKRIGSQSVVDLPSTSTWPDVGTNSRLISFRVVVLPHPDLPSKTNVSPRCTLKVR